MKNLLLLIFFTFSSLYSRAAFSKENPKMDSRIIHMYKQCKQNNNICIAHLSGMKAGFLAGNLQGYASAGGYLTGKYLGKYIQDEKLFKEVISEHFKHMHNKGEQILGCYSSISVDNIRNELIRNVETNNLRNISKGYDILMKDILNELFKPCAYRAENTPFLDN